MKQNIILFVLLVLLGLLIYSSWNTNKITTDIDSYYKRIDSLQTKIDSAMIINDELNQKLTKIDSNVVQINKEILVVDINIQKIKENTNETIASVDTFSISQLQRFFTDRYK